MPSNSASSRHGALDAGLLADDAISYEDIHDVASTFDGRHDIIHEANIGLMRVID